MHLLLPARWQTVAHPCWLWLFVVQAHPPTHTHTPFPPHHRCFPVARSPLSFILLHGLTLICTLWMGHGLASSLALWGQRGHGAWTVWPAKAGGGSQWRVEADLQCSFLWKWKTVTLPSVWVRIGTGRGACYYRGGRDLRGLFFVYEHRVRLLHLSEQRSSDTAPLTIQGCRFSAFPSGNVHRHPREPFCVNE